MKNSLGLCKERHNICNVDTQWHHRESSSSEQRNIDMADVHRLCHGI